MEPGYKSTVAIFNSWRQDGDRDAADAGILAEIEKLEPTIVTTIRDDIEQLVVIVSFDEFDRIVSLLKQAGEETLANHIEEHANYIVT